MLAHELLDEMLSDPSCTTQTKERFYAYIAMLIADNEFGQPGGGLTHSWLRWRLELMGVGKVIMLDENKAIALYNDLVAAFPLRTVALEQTAAEPVPVPYQAPLPSITPEIAQGFWNALNQRMDGPTHISVRDVMLMMQEAVDASPPNELDRLPVGNMVIESADGTETTGMVHQTVCILATGQEYERVVHADEAYGTDEPRVQQEQFWAAVNPEGFIHFESLAALKKDVKKPAKEIEDEGCTIALVELKVSASQWR